MSNALAIASVTAILKDLLDNALIDHSVSSTVGGPVTVTALSPCQIKLDEEAPPRLNLFLYHVTPNAGWRNMGMPSMDGKGDLLTNPPLALDLYYLLTAYGKQDFEAEVLLGYAMQMLHEMPVLTRESIRKTLAKPSPVDSSLLPPLMKALSASDLADQVELIKITPLMMNIEETSKLWTALQASYRPSVAYQASVVLIEGSRPVKSPQPVLTIGPGDKGVISQPDLVPPFPALTSVKPPGQQISASLGDLLTIRGHHLGRNEARVRFMNRRSGEVIEIEQLLSKTANEIKVQIPKDSNPDSPDSSGPSARWPAGFYTMSAVFGKGAKKVATNELALSLAPRIISIDAADKARVKTIVTPQVRPGQRVSLLLGSIEILAQPLETPAYELVFNAKSVPSSSYLARLRVDGVDSLFIDRSSKPPAFKTSPEVSIP